MSSAISPPVDGIETAPVPLQQQAYRTQAELCGTEDVAVALRGRGEAPHASRDIHRSNRRHACKRILVLKNSALDGGMALATHRGRWRRL